MANKQNKQAKRKASNKKMRPVTMVRKSLDAAGLAYARLLEDPCNAPLAHPTYAGTEGGYLFRCDSFVTDFTTPTHTAGVFMFSPGQISTTGSSIVRTSWTDSTTATPAATAIGSTWGPGNTFLLNNAGAVRCVAACLKVTYPGAESGRSGRIHYGQVTSNALQIGSTGSIDAFAQLVPVYERTPAGAIEIIWKPNDADQFWNYPSGTVSDVQNNKTAALLVAAAGLPAGVGLTFHMTAVYEWQPLRGIGIAVPNLNKTPSNNTLDEVINYLINRGTSFLRSTAAGVGKQVTSAALAAAYGLMAPGGGSRLQTIGWA